MSHVPIRSNTCRWDEVFVPSVCIAHCVLNENVCSFFVFFFSIIHRACYS